jgi:hypothetical protein
MWEWYFFRSALVVFIDGKKSTETDERRKGFRD